MNHELLKKIIYDQHQVIKDIIIVERNIELEKEVNYVLVGLRRSGKTTLLYKRVQDLINEGVEWNQIIYINFDDERIIEFARNSKSKAKLIVVTYEEKTTINVGEYEITVVPLKEFLLSN